MTETSQPPAEKQFSIQKIYVKDLSFETPHSPEIFTKQWNPEVSFNLSSSVNHLQEGVSEVNLTVTLTVKIEDQVAYLTEVTQSGIFGMSGFEGGELAHLLGSFCPNLLFPYARETVSDLVTRGGFPPMLLAPVNFDAIYAQHLQEMNGSSATLTSH